MGEMEAMFARAKPALCNSLASSVYVVPEPTVTVEFVGSMVSTLGRPVNETRS
jgi:hypothetical protein